MGKQVLTEQAAQARTFNIFIFYLLFYSSPGKPVAFEDCRILVVATQQE